MATRSLLAGAALGMIVLAASPAAARSETARMAAKMRDPQMQTAIAAAVRALSEAMLDVRVAPFLKAAEAVRDPEAARDIPPDLTLRDVAGPRAERLPRDLSRRVPAMMGAMGGMAGAVEEMKPALEGVAREMGRAMGEAMGEARRGGAPSGDAPLSDEDIPSAQQE